MDKMEFFKKRRLDVLHTLGTPGWKFIEEYLVQEMNSLMSLQDFLGDKIENNKVVVEIKKRETKLACYRDFMNTVKAWTSEKFGQEEKNANGQKNP